VIADLKPYPEYKDSGLPWLGKVPGHWEQMRLKYVFKRIIGGSTPASGNLKYWNGDVTWITPADVSRSIYITRSIRQISRLGMLSCSTEMVPKGSIVITSRAPVGNVAIVDVEFCTNQGCKTLIPDHKVITPIFAFHLLSTMKAEIQSLSSGTTFSEISTSKLGNGFCVLPPPAEQAAIVRFLDWSNKRLDRSIQAKRKIIALLNEQKQAIIHRAVTRGLDPTVKLKPSGIPWLGDIPEHWEVVRNLALFSVRIEQGIPGLPVLQVSLHSGVTIEDLDQFGRPKRLIADHTKYKLVRKGDLAYNTMRMWQGAVGVSPVDGLVSPAYVVITPRRSTNSTFYEYVFRTDFYKQQVNRYSTGIVSDRNRLYWESFKQMPNILLPLIEQEDICQFIHDRTNSLTIAISRLEHEIELLREYRTRLVADVVTGKLDVREAVLRLPDESGFEEESEVQNIVADTDSEEEALEDE
jgi:type I restriction enzyme S subunit